MRCHCRLSTAVAAALCLVCLVVSPVAQATLLWGHPYALQLNNANMGWVHLWNDLNPGSPYVGTATFPSVNFQPGCQNTWDMLVQGMVNKKLTFVWTASGPDTIINDGSTGVIRAAVVTIFGN